MDITPLDITILVASTTGIILMSFAFPALGLTGDETTESDVPSFDIETDRFDMVGDFPSRPGSPDGGTLVWTGDGNRDNPVPGSGSDNDHWITGGTNDGEFIFVINDNNVSDPLWLVGVQDWDNDALTNEENVTLSGQGDAASISEGDWEIRVELDRLYNINESPGQTAEVTYTIENDPTSEDSAWYSGIPVVSATEDAIEWLARTMVFIGNVVQWFVLTIVEFIWNMAFVIYETVTFAFGLASFLVTTYADITTASGLDSWAQVVLLIPGILFMIEWTKVAVVFVDTIWIG